MAVSKIIGVITARGGSKGIPGKNIKLLAGKPLIAYTIEAARESGVFDRLILSTDDEKIAEVAREYGCEVPFMRPAELARDDTPHLPVIQHAVGWLKEKEGYTPEGVMVLQPTSPLRQPFHIKEAVELFESRGADSVLSVGEIPENFSYQKAMIIDENGMLRLIGGRPVYERIARRQELTKTYWSVGMIYLLRTNILSDPVNPNLYGERTAPYYVDEKYVTDINIPKDWEAAEKALDKLKKEYKGE